MNDEQFAPESQEEQVKKEYERQSRKEKWLVAILGCLLGMAIMYFNFPSIKEKVFGEKWYNTYEMTVIKDSILHRSTSSIERTKQLMANSQYLLEYSIAGYYFKGFADGTKGKSEQHFLSCVSKNDILIFAFANYGGTFLKSEILDSIRTMRAMRTESPLNMIFDVDVDPTTPPKKPPKPNIQVVP